MKEAIAEIDKERSCAFCEVYDIVNHLEKDLYNKIPDGFIEMLEIYRDKEYKSNIDFSKDINSQNLLKKTRIILALIYRDYLCDEKTRQKLMEQEKLELEKIEIEKKEKYNPDKLFEDKKIKQIESNEDNKTEAVSLIEYKENIITRIIKKIKLLFS